MEGVECREYRREDSSDLLEVRNSIFPPIPEDQWLKHSKNHTAILAYLGDKPVGAIPLELRPWVIAPGVIVRAAVESAVGVVEGYRDQGIGTAMIEQARDFLEDRSELLMVYRGNERSAAYRFYVKTGHQDLVYLVPVYRQPDRAPETKAVQEDPRALIQNEDEYLAVYREAWGCFGGYIPRQLGYWRGARGGLRFVALPHELFLYRYVIEKNLEAYGLFGIRQTEGHDHKLQVLELASKAGIQGAQEILSAAAETAYKRDLILTDYVCVGHPYRRLYRRMGFTEGNRSLHIMTQATSPCRLFKSCCRYPDALSDLKINVRTPTTEYSLHEGTSAKREVTLEGKDIIIQRLLTRRLNVLAAFMGDLLNIRNGDLAVAGRIHEALPYTTWIHHHLDWR